LEPDLAMSLVTRLGAMVVCYVSILWFFNQDNFHFESLIATVSALVTLVLVLNPILEVIISYKIVHFWLSLLLVVVNLAVMACIMYQEPTYARRWNVWMVIMLFGLGTTLLFWHDYETNIRGVTITVALSTEKDDTSIDARLSALWEQGVAEKFEKQNGGAKVKIVPVPSIVDERLEWFKTQLRQGGDIDVYAIDLTWSEILSPYAEDLKPFIKDPKIKFNRDIVQNNTVEEKLIAVPWYSDAGLLFYRIDLLKKYKYSEPPQTWDELEEMAKTIQDRERSQEGENFWGFVWQGKAYEGLTCNALEWQISHGGGHLVDVKNNVDIKDPTIAAFERAKGWIWIDKISPPDILNHTEAQTFEIWKQKKAVFMRNWPYAYAFHQGENSSISNDVGVTLLPKANGKNTRHASTLGGWQLMVNAASEGKEKKAAIRFVQFLTSKETQRSLAKTTGKPPALRELYDDPEVLRALPFLENRAVKDLFMGDPASNALAVRPSKSTGVKYTPISSTYYKEVNKILSNEKEVKSGVEDLRNELEHILGRGPR
jgi:trehalose/maltose transport system substrate-binding protein